ncbi:MAG: hypothetical protein HRU25_06595 [Psychrobium sp.]|nr:hypothetical protein [Psychrobium sp.]
MKITPFITTCFIASLLLLSTNNINAFERVNKINGNSHNKQPVNVCYESLSQAYLSLSAKKMVEAYAEDGQYISGGKNLAVMQGHTELLSLYNRYFARLKKKDYALDLQFRVSNRLSDTSTISDVGYYIVTIIPPKESKQPPSQHAGKFMITFKKQPNNRWLIWSEANNKVNVANYIGAKRKDNLRFDPYYPIEKYQHK